MPAGMSGKNVSKTKSSSSPASSRTLQNLKMITGRSEVIRGKGFGRNRSSLDLIKYHQTSDAIHDIYIKIAVTRLSWSFSWWEEDAIVSSQSQMKKNLNKKRKKRNLAMFPERGRLLSGQQSSTSSRLLYDGLPCFLGSARSSTLRPSKS